VYQLSYAANINRTAVGLVGEAYLLAAKTVLPVSATEQLISKFFCCEQQDC
jgi:hypothetical protein